MTKAGLLSAPPTKVITKVEVKTVKEQVEVEVMPRFIPPDTPDIFVPIGQDLSRGGSIYLPVVLFDDTLCPADDRDELVANIAQLQLVVHDFRPIFLTSSNDLAVFRRHGYMVEFLMNEERWATMEQQLTWNQYRLDRLNRIAVFHRVKRILPLAAAREHLANLRSPVHP